MNRIFLIWAVAALVSVFFHHYLGFFLRKIKRTDIDAYRNLLGEKTNMWIDRPGLIGWSDFRVVWKLSLEILRGEWNEFLTTISRLCYVLMFFSVVFLWPLFIFMFLYVLAKMLIMNS
jgi:hypothetical protein